MLFILQYLHWHEGTTFINQDEKAFLRHINSRCAMNKNHAKIVEFEDNYGETDRKLKFGHF